jgi:hypothetical protein
MAVPASIASFIAECLAGLFAGIFSNIVLMLFDNTKKSLKVRDEQLQLSLLQSRSLFIDNLKIDVAVLQSSRDICNTYVFFEESLYKIGKTRARIISAEERIGAINANTRTLLETTNHLDQFSPENHDEF